MIEDDSRAERKARSEWPQQNSSKEEGTTKATKGTDIFVRLELLVVYFTSTWRGRIFPGAAGSSLPWIVLEEAEPPLPAASADGPAAEPKAPGEAARPWVSSLHPQRDRAGQPLLPE